MSPTVVAALGVLALASLLQVAGLAVLAVRLFTTWQRLQATGGRMAADLGVVRQNLASATRGFTAAAGAARTATERARPIAGFARNVGWTVGLARRLGLGRAAALVSLLSAWRQRG